MAFDTTFDRKLEMLVKYNNSILEKYMKFYDKTYDLILKFVKCLNANYYEEENFWINYIKEEYYNSEIYKTLSNAHLNLLSANNQYLSEKLAILKWKNESEANATFYSGWLLCPEGEIKNTTPFGG